MQYIILVPKTDIYFLDHKVKEKYKTKPRKLLNSVETTKCGQNCLHCGTSKNGRLKLGLNLLRIATQYRI